MRGLSGFIGVFLLLPGVAFAKCGGQTELRLQDGTRGCVGALELVEFTSSQMIEGGGPATKRSEKYQVPYVRFEQITTPLQDAPKRTRRGWGQQICLQYKAHFQKLGRFTRDPFMVIVFVWGRGEPTRTVVQGDDGMIRIVESAPAEYVHMRPNCRVRRES